jgi:hypothetical protein
MALRDNTFVRDVAPLAIFFCRWRGEMALRDNTFVRDIARAWCRQRGNLSPRHPKLNRETSGSSAQLAQNLFQQLDHALVLRFRATLRGTRRLHPRVAEVDDDERGEDE